MNRKAGTTLSALALIGATLLATPVATAAPVPVPGTAAPAAVQEDPTNQQIMDAFRDEWGQKSFEPTGISDWVPVSTWERAAQYVFAPGSDEYSGEPVAETSLAPLKLDVVTRETQAGERQYQVTETAVNGDGSETANYFPVFSGTPEEMEFYNAAGVPGLPAGEIQQTCRDHAPADRHFLLCRMIASDGSVRYQVKVEQGGSAEGLPGVEEVLEVFRDQWGTDTFTPSGATAWKPVSEWQRFRIFQFLEGTDESTGTPVEFDPTTTRPLTVWMMSRTVDGEPQFTEFSRVTLEDGSTRDDGWGFDRFHGGARDWFHYVSGTGGPPDPGTEAQVHRKVIVVDGQEFLVSRVLPGQDDTSVHARYQVLRSVD